MRFIALNFVPGTISRHVPGIVFHVDYPPREINFHRPRKYCFRWTLAGNNLISSIRAAKEVYFRTLGIGEFRVSPRRGRPANGDVESNRRKNVGMLVCSAFVLKISCCIEFLLGKAICYDTDVRTRHWGNLCTRGLCKFFEWEVLW